MKIEENKTKGQYLWVMIKELKEHRSGEVGGSFISASYHKSKCFKPLDGRGQHGGARAWGLVGN